jgi:hypothetical protein
MQQPGPENGRSMSGRAVSRIGIFRGADRDRTGDLLTASQALSQLSYGPERCGYLHTNFVDGERIVWKNRRASLAFSFSLVQLAFSCPQRVGFAGDLWAERRQSE